MSLDMLNMDNLYKFVALAIPAIGVINVFRRIWKNKLLVADFSYPLYEYDCQPLIYYSQIAILTSIVVGLVIIFYNNLYNYDYVYLVIAYLTFFVQIYRDSRKVLIYREGINIKSQFIKWSEIETCDVNRFRIKLVLNRNIDKTLRKFGIIDIQDLADKIILLQKQEEEKRTWLDQDQDQETGKDDLNTLWTERRNS